MLADNNPDLCKMYQAIEKTLFSNIQKQPQKQAWMGKETERKFLVKDRRFEKEATEVISIVQGYVCNQADKNVRIRIAGEKAFLTIKGKTSGYSRQEFEYPIPVEEAREILSLFCSAIIRKKRYLVPDEKNTWEVDVFEDDNDGLILAEIELPDESTIFRKPLWIGEEVTGNPDYYNVMLINKPFQTWNKKG